ncbi:hypothetical protein [Metabacillus fastidiosus]|uniref:hypothetical protein n=1 Tax=Metabacillus fastidiosus TaxID=1458 RepID=UPI002E217B34|nr:hypothetical protein [Metabacillus fastidiosus]
MSEIYFNHSVIEDSENDHVIMHLNELLKMASIVKENNYSLRFSDRLWNITLKRGKLSNFMFDMQKYDAIKPFLMAAMGNGPHFNEIDVEERLSIIPHIQSGTSSERILYTCLNNEQSLVMSLINEPLLVESNYKVQNSSNSIEVKNIMGENSLISYFRSSISFKTIDEVFERIEELRPNIIILDSAKKSAKMHHFQGKYDAVFDTLLALEDIELGLMADGVNDEIRKVEFYKYCGFDISGESTKTMQKSSCVRLREFVIPGRGKEVFEWHAKIGVKTRIHYYIDLESRNVYIGHCGKHLKT